MDHDQFIADIPRDLAYHAHQGTSFSPEKRADAARADYSHTLASDYAKLKAHAEKAGTMHMLEEEFARYRANYAAAYRAWLSSKSRCISWMITGPARFPVSRAQKWSNAAQRRADLCIELREKAMRSIIRKLRPDLRPIMAGDADAIERLGIELAGRERRQAMMKEANAAIRKHIKQGQEAAAIALVDLGFSADEARELVTPSKSWRGQGFASFELSNNNANIRRIRERLEHLERMHATPVQDVEANGFRVVIDPPANRVRLYFSGKPDEASRAKLKSSGFRWVPSEGAWQGYINSTTQRVAKEFLNQAKEATA